LSRNRWARMRLPFRYLSRRDLARRCLKSLKVYPLGRSEPGIDAAVSRAGDWRRTSRWSDIGSIAPVECLCDCRPEQASRRDSLAAAGDCEARQQPWVGKCQWVCRSPCIWKQVVLKWSLRLSGVLFKIRVSAVGCIALTPLGSLAKKNCWYRCCRCAQTPAYRCIPFGIRQAQFRFHHTSIPSHVDSITLRQLSLASTTTRPS
jgi:hypothetical protein